MHTSTWDLNGVVIDGKYHSWEDAAGLLKGERRSIKPDQARENLALAIDATRKLIGKTLKIDDKPKHGIQYSIVCRDAKALIDQSRSAAFHLPKTDKTRTAVGRTGTQLKIRIEQIHDKLVRADVENIAASRRDAMGELRDVVNKVLKFSRSIYEALGSDPH